MCERAANLVLVIGEPHEEAQRVSRLIAQAPAMVEFLESLMHDSDSMHLWTRAQAIIDAIDNP